MRHSQVRHRRWKTLLPPIHNRRPDRQAERSRAQLAVAVALRDGRLEKQPCETCGAVEGVEAHHDDLAAPLDVRWLCATHQGSVASAAS